MFVRTQEVVGMRRTELDRGRETERAREWGMKGTKYSDETDDVIFSLVPGRMEIMHE